MSLCLTLSWIYLTLTSVTPDGLCPPQEAQVACPRVGLTHVAPAHKSASTHAHESPGVKCQDVLLGGEVVRVAGVLVVDGVVAAGVVRALHPDLAQVAVPALALGLGVCDDDVDPRQQLPGLHEGEGVGAAALHQRHPVVSQRPQVHKHCGGVRRGRALG